MVRSGSRPASRGVVATWLLILAACAGTLLGCGNDVSAPSGTGRPSASSAGDDAAPPSNVQAIVGTWRHARENENLYLVIAPDGSIDDGQGLPWLKEGETATIRPVGGNRFVLTSSASPARNELELSPDGNRLTSADGIDAYIRSS